MTTSSHDGRDPIWIRVRLFARRLWDVGLLPKVASAGLLIVLMSVSGFAMWSARSTSQAAERAIASSTMSDHFSLASAAVSEQESLERKYRLEPGPEVRRRYDKASHNLLDAGR